MNMSNEEKDKFIRESLQKDIHVFSSNNNLELEIEKDINASNIKQRKSTYGERKFTTFLIILLCVSLGWNAYFVSNSRNKLNYLISQKMPQVTEKNNDMNNTQKTNDNITSTNTENTNVDNTVVENNDIENNNVTDISEITPILPKPDIEDVIIEDKETEKNNFALDIDEGILKEELVNYAIAIGRFEGQIDTLEENTIALLMAHNSFSSKKAQIDSNKISVKYALTADNVHLFIAELTGTKIDNFLNSYSNYIGYSEFSNGYVFGKDANILANEKYEVLELKVKNKNNTGYEITGIIQKTVDNKKCNYEFTAVISAHKEYTYNPYKINSFTAKLQKGHTDNVMRLVDYVEEIEDEKSKKNK